MNQAEQVVWRYLLPSRPSSCIDATSVLATEGRVALSNVAGNTSGNRNAVCVKGSEARDGRNARGFKKQNRG